MNEETNTAQMVVPDRQLSLAIGKEGQNARLAAKLTGWRIDIKSQSLYEEYLEQLSPEERAKLEAEAEAQAAPAEGVEAEPALVGAKQVTPELEAVAGLKEPEEAPVEEGPLVEAPAAGETVAAEPVKPQIRFAEEILPGARAVEDKGEEGAKAAKPKKRRKKRRIVQEDEDEGVEYDVH